jgi:malate dehydrogenase (oxaloacetate-decarboxylating)(NADP+)
MSESNVKYTEAEALDFHSRGRPGKIEIIATKPMATQRDLALAYSPGVAVPVRQIAGDPGCAYDYTAKGNLVAVISNGTAILGLGNLGALAAKPVMEGKAVLFKRFADVDSIDIEVKTDDAQRFIDAVELLEPSFGGINLEDIAAPDCFVIEQALRERMNIPVFHDDQHGTAIITAAGLINACLLTGRELSQIQVVVNGAGAAAIACTELIKAMGVKGDHVIMCDRKGVIHKGRSDIDQWKSAHAVETEHGRAADHLRHGQSRPRDHSASRPRGAAGRDYRDGSVRLSEPGQQCSRLSLHLSWSARRARDGDQRGDEDRRRRSAG